MLIPCNHLQHAKSVALALSAQFQFYSLLDSNNAADEFDWMAGMGNLAQTAEYSQFTDLSNFFLVNKGQYLFGHLNYDLKNNFEKLDSQHHNTIDFPLWHFFVPEITIIARKSSLEILEAGNISLHSKSLLDWFKRQLDFKGLKDDITFQNRVNNRLHLEPRTSQKKYLDSFEKILEHLKAGNIYELNYCIEFFEQNAVIDPVNTYLKLCELTEAPMGCFYKHHDNYLLCASPERFLKLKGDHLISQPIKGTIKRAVNAGASEKMKAADLQLKKLLETNEKERAENIMIVDLVRNDLSHIAQKGTVKVNELCGIYTFKTVHQMISTISCTIKEDVDFTEIIRNLFPMGSMTGAPKIRAMQLIEAFEDIKRGLFSGSVGYIAPNGDFDFNVVIRSIFYNAALKYVSIIAGSAITVNADAEKEYEECLLKLEALKKALNNH